MSSRLASLLLACFSVVSLPPIKASTKLQDNPKFSTQNNLIMHPHQDRMKYNHQRNYHSDLNHQQNHHHNRHQQENRPFHHPQMHNEKKNYDESWSHIYSHHQKLNIHPQSKRHRHGQQNYINAIDLQRAQKNTYIDRKSHDKLYNRTREKNIISRHGRRASSRSQGLYHYLYNQQPPKSFHNHKSALYNDQNIYQNSQYRQENHRSTNHRQETVIRIPYHQKLLNSESYYQPSLRENNHHIQGYPSNQDYHTQSYPGRYRQRMLSSKYQPPPNPKTYSIPDWLKRIGSSILTRKRKRRAKVKSQNRRYTYGIVPFTFDPSLSDDQRAVILRTMSVFENVTCIRFVDRILQDGRSAKYAYRLGHNGYIAFVNHTRCFASRTGNVGVNNRVSCCDFSKCFQVIGKALGQKLSQRSFPRNIGFLQVSSKSKPVEKTISRYLKDLQQKRAEVKVAMSLHSKIYKTDKSISDPILIHYDDIIQNTRLYYFFNKISSTHQCHKNNCSHFEEPCFNNGYVSLVQGQCTCVCPDGLDPETACSTTLGSSGNPHKCGDIISLTDENPTSQISFTSKGQGGDNCAWLVEVPEDDTILIDFDEFDIDFSNADNNTECENWLEIRQTKIGQSGTHYCGKRLPHAIISQSDQALLRFVTSKNKDFGKDNRRQHQRRSKFTVTVKLISKETLCYNPSDKGFTYAGKINYSRDFSPCVPWWKVTHCEYHPYKYQFLYSSLSDNYCRNPGNGERPWCYVNPEGCLRQYCDVCLLEKPRDTATDCSLRIKNNSSKNYCTDDEVEARRTCAKECRDDLFQLQPSVANVTCGKPDVPADGIQLNHRKRSEFSVGEFVTFRCSHINKLYRTTVKKYCLSNGEWTHANYSCLPCHINKGWILHKESCYSVRVGKKSAHAHQAKCRQNGGNLVNVKSWEEQKFLSYLVYSKGVRSYYIGANDAHKEGKFYFKDFSLASWSNWDLESVNGKGIDCVMVDIKGVWRHTRCHHKLPAVCKAPLLRHRRPIGLKCVDFRRDCEHMIKLDSNLCQREHGVFASTQCTRTCDLC